MKQGPLARIAVALDTSDRQEFGAWCRLFGPRVGVLKVGLEAFSRWGPQAIEEAQSAGARVFADLKLHDIPSTVAGATAAMKSLGVDYLTVHASGGPVMLEAAATAAGGDVDLLAVTLLTHLDEEARRRLHLPGDASERALGWARLARGAGCAGSVCSPLEVAVLRQALAPPFQLVTPGVRMAPIGREDDQRRTASPEAAVEAGADLLVIGRPLTRAADPVAELAALESRLSLALEPS